MFSPFSPHLLLLLWQSLCPLSLPPPLSQRAEQRRGMTDRGSQRAPPLREGTHSSVLILKQQPPSFLLSLSLTSPLVPPSLYPSFSPLTLSPSFSRSLLPSHHPSLSPHAFFHPHPIPDSELHLPPLRLRFGAPCEEGCCAVFSPVSLSLPSLCLSLFLSQSFSISPLTSFP